eukprot:1737114-Pyramimonas_sp.AAC.2
MSGFPRTQTRAVLHRALRSFVAHTRLLVTRPSRRFRLLPQPSGSPAPASQSALYPRLPWLMDHRI